MKKSINKLKNVYNEEGLYLTLFRILTFSLRFLRINIFKRALFLLNKRRIQNTLKTILNNEDYKRLLVWRSSLGWNIQLFQRPQHIAKELSDNKCLILYEANRKTDKVNFIKKQKDNLYLVDYELDSFNKLLFSYLQKFDRPKYLQIYSTNWDLPFDLVNQYISNKFSILYEYIDELTPVLAGVKSLPQNVLDIYNYVINNKEVMVVSSADKLYKEICTRRKSKINIVLSSNGVDVNHFNKEKSPIESLDKIKLNYQIMIGYYGALASWFDYDLVYKIAKQNPKIAFILLGIKYDNSYQNSKLKECQNIYYLGPVNYKYLPNYASYFDIAWIPFVINEITMSTNPLKAFEYMALGKYIISSDMPECRKYKSINIAHNIEEYQYYIDNYSKLYTKNYKELLKKEALQNSWEEKAGDIIKLLEKQESR